MMSSTSDNRNKRTKVLMLITKSVWGGAQRYVFDLSTRLPTDRYEVVVAAGGDGPLTRRLAAAGIRTITLPSLDRNISLANDVRSFFQTWAAIGREKPDIVHVNSSKAAGIGALAARLRRVKGIVFTVHGWPHHERVSMLAMSVRFLLSWITALFSDIVITLSKRELDYGRRMWLCKSRMKIVSNGIEIPVFVLRHEARLALRDASGRELQPEAFLVGSVAELTPNKGLLFAIRAMADVSRDIPTLRYVIVGDGEEKAALQKLVEDLRLGDMVIFTGHMDHAERYMTAFDAFLLPSLKEGLPYVILEAGAAGLPVVASDVGGVSDIITQCESGILVHAGNEKEIAQSIGLLSRDKSIGSLYGAHLKQKVKEHFSVEKMINSTSRIYEALV